MNKNNSPKLSIIIPTKKRPAEVEQLFQDLSQQTYDHEEVQVVLFNDGRDVATEQVANKPWPFSVLYLFSDGDTNSCASRNQCLDHATATNGILFLDDDMRLEADFLEKAMSTLETYQAFSCRIITPRRTQGHRDFLPPKWRRRVLPWLGFISGGFSISEEKVHQVDHLPGCMMMFRSDIAQQVRFDPWIGQGNGYLDDADYSHTIKKQLGVPLHYVPKFSVVHLQASSGGNREVRTDIWWFYALLHRRWFFRKHVSKVWVITLWLGTLGESVLRAWRGRINLLPVWVRVWQTKLPKDIENTHA